MKTGNDRVVVMPLLLALALPLAACSAAPGDDARADEDGDALSSARRPKATKASLGALIFKDTRLSEPPGQACATCHDASVAFTDPRPQPTSEGAVAGRFGVRNTPTILYSSYTVAFGPAGPGENGGFVGGLFYDGRAATLQDQVSGPLLNKLEMNNPDTATIQRKLQAAPYASQIRALYGRTALDTPDAAMSALADAIAAYETTGMPNRFTSKYDAYLAGQATLSDAEARGLALFESERTGPCTNGGPPCGCAQCHIDKAAADGSPPLFTDFGYDNLGIPKNPNNPYYTMSTDLNPVGAKYNDYALGWRIANPKQYGHFKAPTLRNVALTAPYGHNGYFADLKSIVHFYNTRDVASEAWPAPESTFFLNRTGVGNLGLTSDEEDDIVAFLGTLTDGYQN